MKRLFATIAVVCLFSIPALAGDIPTLGTPQPTQASSTDPGDIPSGGAPATSTAPGEIPTGDVADHISDEALSALLSVLSFLG